jgi:predicted nucleic acid-binding protein
MNFLIDTNVLSEYNRTGGPDPGVKRWLEKTDRQSQYVSVITLAEIQKGIELLAQGKRRVQLEQWLGQDLEAWFAGRVLPVDRQVAARWASLLAQGARAGRPLPAVDSLIAATALAYDLTIVTRNTRDFEGIGATTINPWESRDLAERLDP